MGRFDRQIATAKAAIKKNGELCTWRKPTAATPGVGEQPWKPVADTPVDYEDTPIMFIPEGGVGGLHALVGYLKGTEVPTGSTKAYMASTSFTPSIKDVVIRSSGETLRIKAIDTLSPNGQIILHTIEFDQ